MYVGGMGNIFIIQTFPNGEQKAANWIKDHLGLETYCPMAIRYFRPRRQKSKEPIEVLRPVFSGYLFLYEKHDILDWYPLAPCPYIYGYVSNEDGAVPIAAEKVERLRALVAAGEYDQDLETFLRPCNFEVGEAVLICPDNVAMLGEVIEIGLNTVTVQTLAHGVARPFIVPVDHPVPAKVMITSLSR